MLIHHPCNLRGTGLLFEFNLIILFATFEFTYSSFCFSYFLYFLLVLRVIANWFFVCFWNSFTDYKQKYGCDAKKMKKLVYKFISNLLPYRCKLIKTLKKNYLSIKKFISLTVQQQKINFVWTLLKSCSCINGKQKLINFFFKYLAWRYIYMTINVFNDAILLYFEA